MHLTERLERCYSGAVYDVLRARGHSDCVLPNTILPLDPEKKLAGRVYTVVGHVDPSLDSHQTLLSWITLFVVNHS